MSELFGLFIEDKLSDKYRPFLCLLCAYERSCLLWIYSFFHVLFFFTNGRYLRQELWIDCLDCSWFDYAWSFERCQLHRLDSSWVSGRLEEGPKDLEKELGIAKVQSHLSWSYTSITSQPSCHLCSQCIMYRLPKKLIMKQRSSA